MKNYEKSFTRQRLLATAVIAAPLLAMATPAMANHAWSTYHWARTTNPFTLKLGDNLNSTWKPYLQTTSIDWTKSSVLDTVIVAGQSSARRCPSVNGTVQVCNNTYGNTGWLGVASISVNGSHITSGTVKLNDTYFNTAQYNSPAWRNLVSCQEVGHTFGLGHQDENFTNANLDTCMDYTNLPDSNQHPNQHDYDMLVTIYSHLDTTTTIGAIAVAGAASGETPAEWGRATHFTRDGRPDEFERIDGPGLKTITHVFWAIGEGPRGR